MRGHTEEALVIDRRQFVTVAGSLVAACVAPSLRRALATAPPASEVIERLDALFDVFMDERLTKNPDQLTVLGLDKGKYAWARSKLTEASLQWVRESKQDNASRLKRLRAFGRSTLSGADLVNYDTVEFQMETIARTEPFEYGDGVRPYVVSQLTGAYQSIPTFLDRQHRIENREDAEAYLARLRAFAVVLDQETERVRHDAGLKVAPPDFLIERALEQMRTLHSTEPADSILTTSIAKRTQKLGLQGSYGTDAARIVTAEVYPALERQMQALAELRPGAAHEAGVGRLPQGEALYHVALRQGTTTALSPDEVPCCARRARRVARCSSACRGLPGTRATSIPTPMPAGSRSSITAMGSLPPCSRVCRSISTSGPRRPWKSAGCRPTRRPGRRAATTRFRRSTHRARAPSTSICATPANGHAGSCLRWCITSPSPDITSSWRWCWRCPRCR